MATEIAEFSGGIASTIAEIEKVNNADPENAIGGLGAAAISVAVVDGRLSPAEDGSWRFYNHASPTVGSDDAHMVLPIVKGEKYECHVFHMSGANFDTSLSAAATKELGAKSGATALKGTTKLLLMLKDT